ncbi:SDR family NAD(P)-dependent oxidoreductase [Nocardia sp. NBC_00508]|uniref:SDR family NAD(P)-dependent oxidoreductase n=1 Tax=Nocardia sp. NBC_00508 TaxID=2975992 RepID=UPI002E8039FD|nr:SDR family NAD(P)-dependent oxidoreductase [Nocardia sp. NBC_00508]WUD67475.1 SDR family NAD(P)-dependent oxidoreductase [Nocardia sp. NBC_00508]
MSDQQTVLITGGTGSLGFRAAEAILRADPDRVVAITGRGGAAVDAASARLGDRAVGLPLDLASLSAVRRFARGFGELGLPPLHAIVCNAGTQIVSDTVRTADGIEQTFAVNHLAHFLLVRELLPTMATPGRIVFVASDTHDPTKPTGMPRPVYTTAWDLAYPADSDATAGPGPAGRRRYTTSKLCNVLATYEFARYLDTGTVPPAVTVNAFDPGLMPGTGLGRDYRGIQGWAWRNLLPALTIVPGINVHTPRRSAAALARLVLAPELAGTTGRYFSGRREIKSSAESYDIAKGEDLWTTSVEIIEKL